ncbi:DUF1934 domain-containing protein [Tepidibacter formicigenes]|uniref:Uncharacterized beta-barrel protein YwiB, DUF1934 family n=1 Tax=Tepidibacter formicigenes DSM 15518 TaxID=1123349 RepID=A0A1M6TQ51_9FIRM|nr:DUF1934 domain-containing protein [Tepidibacter formicigenes]SHK59067.1 Uncharacterized beta-barrel protein YwiB, DUF1934 family [Tepidibacter formicigenes DSM 15518]
MNQEVVIKMKTCQIDSKGEKDTMELITQGKIYKKNKALYIVYEESEISGMAGTTTTLKITEDCITMKRFGKNNSELIFKKGKRFKTKYRTVHGDFSIETLTKSIDVEMSQDLSNIDININYDINISGLFEGKNIISIKVN